MAHTKAYTTSFERDKLYHVFNRTVGDELLFRSDENYRFFLSKYKLYLGRSVETISYCLLPNHFHFFVRVIDEKQLSTKWKKFFQSYALAFNRTYKRRGSLFDRPFKRNEVNRDEYITRLIRYIHQNPQKHFYTQNFREWKWSSFHEIYNKGQKRLTSCFTEEWFMSKPEFDSFHAVFETESRME